MIKGITSDGETVTWEVDNAKDISKNTVYTYTEEDDVYTLTEAEATAVKDDATAKFTTSAITTSTKRLTIGEEKTYFASDVKFIFIDDGKATVLDGVQKVAEGKTAWATINVEDVYPGQSFHYFFHQ